MWDIAAGSARDKAAVDKTESSLWPLYGGKKRRLEENYAPSANNKYTHIRASDWEFYQNSIFQYLQRFDANILLFLSNKTQRSLAWISQGWLILFQDRIFSLKPFYVYPSLLFIYLFR